MFMASLEPWKNLTLEEIYFPEFQEYIRICFSILFLLTCIIYPTSFYIILTQSTKEMGNYKYLLCYHLACAFVFHFLIFLFKPVFLFPLPIGYINSYVNLGQNFLFIYFALTVSVIICGVHALFISFAYRAGVTFMDGPIHYYFDNVKLMIISNVLALVIVITLFITPILHDATSIPILQAALIKDIPILSEFFQLHPNAAGYHINFITDWFDLLGYDSVIFGAFLPIAFLTMHLIFRWRMKKLKNIFNKNTIKAHKMLYRALTVQFIISIILLFTPLIIFMGTYLSQIKNGTIYASLAINIGGLEPIFNCLSMLYFIRPYRKYVLEKFQTYIYSGSHNNHHNLPTNLEGVAPSVFTTEG